MNKSLTLKNHQNQSLNFTLRLYQEGDEQGMIACILDEYGDTYFKRDFYNVDLLEKAAKEGRITFLVAETEDNDIAGMLILKQFYPKEAMCEIASQIFRKKYRGYGLAMPFFMYGMEILMSKFYSAAFCLPVLFHNITQRLLYRLGLCATGLVINVFDMDKISHSYTNGRNNKHSQGIQVRALWKTDAGVLYIPKEHQTFCQAVYKRLGVDFCIAEPTDPFPKQNRKIVPFHAVYVQPENTDFNWKNDEIQQSLEIYIYQVGKDFKQQISQLHSQIPLKGKQTANIFLNINDVYAVWAYELLQEMGYFFTGLKPLCSGQEYMVLHHCGDVEIYFNDYIVSDEFVVIVDYIKKCYENRYKFVF